MKLIKAKIEVEHPSATSTNFIGYPQSWTDNAPKIHMFDPGDRLEEITENGKIYKIIYAFVEDDVNDILLAEKDIIEAADQVEMKAYIDMKSPPRMMTTSQEAVNAVLVKIVKGQPLSPKEKNAIDPEHPEAGVTMTKSWFDQVQDNHGKLTS